MGPRLSLFARIRLLLAIAYCAVGSNGSLVHDGKRLLTLVA
jgi:hypothetical protein